MKTCSQCCQIWTVGDQQSMCVSEANLVVSVCLVCLFVLVFPHSFPFLESVADLGQLRLPLLITIQVDFFKFFFKDDFSLLLMML